MFSLLCKVFRTVKCSAEYNRTSGEFGDGGGGVGEERSRLGLNMMVLWFCSFYSEHARCPQRIKHTRRRCE
jgi:hypothetical protein